MNTEELAHSRYRIYDMLSAMLIGNITPEPIEWIRSLPNPALPMPQTLDDWKAMHYALFGLNVYPYENEFLNEVGFLGGTITQSLAILYGLTDFQADESEPLDHIGNQLSFMASLCHTEAQAHHDGVIQAVYFTTELQRKVLDEHLLRWSPALIMAIHEQGDNPFLLMAEMLLETLLHHRTALDDDSGFTTVQFKIPPAPDILNHAGTDFSDIADYLLTPIYSGIYLSRDDIVRLSQKIELPHGHGKRHLMLTRLMNNAIEAGKLIELLSVLEEKVIRWQKFYQHEVTIPDYSELWIDRLNTTRHFLVTIRSAL